MERTWIKENLDKYNIWWTWELLSWSETRSSSMNIFTPKGRKTWQQFIACLKFRITVDQWFSCSFKSFWWASFLQLYYSYFNVVCCINLWGEWLDNVVHYYLSRWNHNLPRSPSLSSHFSLLPMSTLLQNFQAFFAQNLFQDSSSWEEIQLLL